MSATAVPVEANRLPSSALRRFAWAVLAYFIAVILWGALVRATGSGAGCGDHWPLCNGTVIQHSPRTDTMIEFTHRITSGISFFSVVALLWWTFAGTVRGHLARTTALASVVFTLIEAALGAFLVKLGLTAQSRSPLRAPYLALHLTNTLLLLAALTLTAHLLGRWTGYLRGRDPHRSAIRSNRIDRRRAHRRRYRIAGRTGRHALPREFAGRGMAQDFSSTSGWLVRWRWTHPTVGVRGWHLSHLATGRAAQRGTHWDNRGLSALVLFLLAGQYVLGVLDVVLLAPVWLQIAHLLGADVLWSALVVLAARLTLEPAEGESRTTESAS